MINIAQWLESLGLGQYAGSFEENAVGLDQLSTLTDDELKELGVGALGHRKRIRDSAKDLETESQRAEAAKTESTTSLATTGEAERRQLTVMFVDLVGSTSLSERMDPEEFRDVIAAYQAAVSKAVEQYDGYIARYMGDGLLVYFGYPKAHEDDAERAVRAGLGIVDSISQLDSEIDTALQARVGIATGLVVAGDIIGEGSSEEHAVLGDTPNLAARLESIAPPGGVIVAESTQRLVEGLFVLETLGSQPLKGISILVTAFRVTGSSDAPSRFEAAAAQGLTPLVGRQVEIQLLRDRWTQTKDGEGQVVVLSGEAGVGKSRIVRGFQEQTRDELKSRVLYFCSPHHQSSALHPVIDQLQRVLRFQPDDQSAKKLDKLESMLHELDLPLQDYAPTLASLLSLPLDGRYPELEIEIASAELRRKTFEALLAVFEAMTTRTPVLTVLEDTHWIDPSTEEFLGLLIERVRSLSLLVVVTHRPEYTPPWGQHAHMTSLALNRLSRRECVALVEEVTNDKALPAEVLDQIVVKTDGIPLFVEELTKAMLDSGLLEERADRFELVGPLTPLAIPASLQDALTARLDRLAPVKEIAQLAATIGRSFNHELLLPVSRLTENELGDALAQLVEAGLIYRRRIGVEITHEFKHALVQETAYHSLLKSKRLQYHQRIADVIADKYPDVVETQPELLAHHYTEANMLSEAIDYWCKAGQRAVARSAYTEAIAHLQKGLELVDGLPSSYKRIQQELDLHIALGPALIVAHGPASQEVERTYTRARELCQQVGDTDELFSVTWGLWMANQFNARFDNAQALADETLALAERQADPGLKLQAHHAIWTTHLARGDVRLGWEHAIQGIEIYDIDEHGTHSFRYGGHDPGVCAHNHAAITSWLLGYPDRAVVHANDSVSLTEDLGQPFNRLVAHAFASWLYQYRREPLLVREHAQFVITLCEERGLTPQHLFAARVLRGWASAATGQVADGIAEIREGLHWVGASARRSYYLSILAQVYVWSGESENGLTALAEALEFADQTGERTWDAELHRLKGELLLLHSKDNSAEAADCFGTAIHIAHGQGAKSLELRAATSLANLWNDQDKRDEARDLLSPVYDWFTEGFDTADLNKAKVVLDELA